MKIITLRVYTDLVRAVFLVVFFHHKMAALWAVLVYRLEMAYKIALGVICTTEKFLASASGFSRNNVA